MMASVKQATNNPTMLGRVSHVYGGDLGCGSFRERAGYAVEKAGYSAVANAAVLMP